MYNNMVQYYDARQASEAIYRDDTHMSGDINGGIFDAMNRFKYIDKIESKIQDLKLNIVLKEGTSEKQKQKVKQYISDTVGQFISENIDNINSDDKELKDYIRNNSDHLFDYKEVGNAVEISL